MIKDDAVPLLYPKWSMAIWWCVWPNRHTFAYQKSIVKSSHLHDATNGRKSFWTVAVSHQRKQVIWTQNKKTCWKIKYIFNVRCSCVFIEYFQGNSIHDEMHTNVLIVSPVSFVLQFPEYTIYADVTKSIRGYPRIIHDGYAFGLWNASTISEHKIARWVCTGSQPISRKRCCAAISTKMIDGYVMMCNRKQKHICSKWADTDTEAKPYNKIAISPFLKYSINSNWIR